MRVHIAQAEAEEREFGDGVVAFAVGVLVPQRPRRPPPVESGPFVLARPLGDRAEVLHFCLIRQRDHRCAAHRLTHGGNQLGAVERDGPFVPHDDLHGPRLVRCHQHEDDAEQREEAIGPPGYPFRCGELHQVGDHARDTLRGECEDQRQGKIVGHRWVKPAQLGHCRHQQIAEVVIVDAVTCQPRVVWREKPRTLDGIEERKVHRALGTPRHRIMGTHPDRREQCDEKQHL